MAYINTNYNYDVFLSWTGHNREEKNIVRAYLKENGLSVYDSDVEYNGYSCLDALSMKFMMKLNQKLKIIISSN